jgi:LysM repeat protein
MKKIYLFITLFLIVFFTNSQEKKYISYEVKQNETLKSIAQDFNLSVKDLSNLNPDVSRKPVLGTIIIVPNKNYGKSTTTIVESNKQVEVTNEDVYTVMPKETLFGVSKKFGVTIDALKTANPQLENGMKAGMQLVIPKPVEVSEIPNYKLHTVVKDDTVYNLTKRYGVSEADLFALNPQLKEGLKLGMTLKIATSELPETNEINKNVVEFNNKIGTFKENLHLNRQINLAIILPYKLNSLPDSLLNDSFAKNNLLNIAIDFHMGSKIAIDSLKSKGLKVNVSYFDSENSEQKLQILLNRNQNFNSKDLIIGPLFFDNAYWISQRTKTPVLVPTYSKKQETLSRQNLIKTAPNASLNQHKLLAHLQAIYSGENIVIVNDGLAETQTQLWQIVNKIKSFKNSPTVSVIKPEKGYINRTYLSSKINNSTKNWVIIISDDNVTTSATLNGLKVVPEDTEITLFALNKGKNYDTIDNNLLAKFNFTFPTSEFIDTDSEYINNFYNAYFKETNAFPSKYALRGFDTTYDAIVRLASENGVEEGLSAGKSTRTISTFEYAKTSNGGFENNGLFLIQYNKDLSVTIID